jgi:hypothetical protein
MKRSDTRLIRSIRSIALGNTDPYSNILPAMSYEVIRPSAISDTMTALVLDKPVGTQSSV